MMGNQDVTQGATDASSPNQGTKAVGDIWGKFIACALWEKAMVTHISALTWKIPWMEEPGGLQSMGSQRVRHD